MIDRGFRIVARIQDDERYLLTAAEKTDLTEALNEFARHHDVPIMSPVWASRIGLASAVGALAVSRISLATAPAARDNVVQLVPTATGLPASAVPEVSDWLHPNGPPH